MIESRAPAEADIQSGILEAAALGGWLAYHTHDSRRSHVGFPDLVLVRPPEVLLLELKGARGRVSEVQREWIAALQGCDQVTAAIIYPEAYDTVIRHLLRPSASAEQLSALLREL